MGEGFWCLRVSPFVKPKIGRGMCNCGDNTAGMRRRGLVTEVRFSPLSTEGKRLLLLSQLDWSEPGWCCTDLGAEYVSFLRAETWKEVSWDINAREEIEHPVC